LNPDFLQELAPQAGFAILTGIEFPAGELPAAGEMFAGGSLRDQHTAIAADDRTGDDVHRIAAQGTRPSAARLLKRAVTVLVLLARSARAGIVAPDFRHGTRERHGHRCIARRR
jgi:hypothetical protein